MLYMLNITMFKYKLKYSSSYSGKNIMLKKLEDNIETLSCI